MKTICPLFALAGVLLLSPGCSSSSSSPDTPQPDASAADSSDQDDALAMPAFGTTVNSAPCSSILDCMKYCTNSAAYTCYVAPNVVGACYYYVDSHVPVDSATLANGPAAVTSTWIKPTFFNWVPCKK